MNKSRHVGKPDFHDGFILTISRNDDKLSVVAEGSSGRHYTVVFEVFEGVTSVESQSPEGMMLYALSDAEADSDQLRQYEFINWYVDESEKESKAYLRITAESLKVWSFQNLISERKRPPTFLLMAF